MVTEAGAASAAGVRGVWARVRRIVRGVRIDPGGAFAGVGSISLFLVGMSLILRSSPWGIGIRVDSLSYLTAAQNLAQGRCLCWLGSGLELKPLVHFGPVYPSLVAAGTVFGLTVLESARLLAAVLFGGNLALSSWMVYAMTKSLWAGIAAAFLFGASPAVMEAHDSAMTEPLFLLLMMGGFLALSAYLDARRLPALWLALGTFSVALLARYAAGGMLLAGAGALLLLNRGSWTIRIRQASLFALACLLPTSLWLLRNLSRAGTFTNRVLGYHPLTVDDARTFLDIVTRWFTRGSVSHWLEGLVLAGLLGAAAWIMWECVRSGSESERRAGSLGVVLLLFLLAYPLTLALSRTYFDARIPIDNRMLSPWYVCLALLAATILAVAARRTRWKALIALPAFLFLLGPGQNALGESRRVLARLQGEGVGFASRAWKESPSLAWTASLPPDALLYSNKALVIQLLLGRAAYQPPERYDEVKAELRQDFLADLDRMYADLARPDSYLLMFDPVRPIGPADVEDEFTVGLVMVEMLGDGVVYADPSTIAVP